MNEHITKVIIHEDNLNTNCQDDCLNVPEQIITIICEYTTLYFIHFVSRFIFSSFFTKNHCLRIIEFNKAPKLSVLGDSLVNQHHVNHNEIYFFYDSIKKLLSVSNYVQNKKLNKFTLFEINLKIKEP